MSGNMFRRSLTMLELVIATAIFTVVLFGVAGLTQSSGDTADLVHNQTAVQLEAERILRLVRDQLRLTGVEGGGQLQINLTPPPPAEWEISFHTLGGGELFNPADPYGSLPWSTETHRLRFEHTDDPLNGLDDDGDALVDEGRLALYRDANPTPVAILGENLAEFRVEEEAGVRTRVHLTVTVERVLRAAVKTSGDVQAMRQGGGPRMRHTSDLWLTIPN